MHLAGTRNDEGNSIYIYIYLVCIYIYIIIVFVYDSICVYIYSDLYSDLCRSDTDSSDYQYF